MAGESDIRTGIYVGGRWLAGHSGRSFESFNPADRDEALGTLASGDAADVEAAVQASKAAYPAWAATPVPRRADHILRVGLGLERRKEELARLMTREMGKTLRETRADIQEAIDFAFYMAGEGRRFFGQTMPSELPGKFSMTLRAPIGVVGAITPWNFPIAIPMWKLAPALLAGNTVVFKPPTDTALCAVELVAEFIETGLPDGVLNLVTGSGAEAGEALVNHPDVRAISFTGSLDVGRHIATQCAQAMKRVSLELGGKNCLIVMPDADMELAVEAAAWGAFATAGQRCTATSRILVHEKVKAAFTERLLARVARMKAGDGLDPDVEIAPVINEAQCVTVLDYIEIGKAEGARLLTGGTRLTEGGLEKGSFIAPTVFDAVSPTMRIAQEEIFGPVTALIDFADLDEAIAIANGTNYGLSASIYTRDITATFEAISRLEFGVVYVNAPTIGAEVQLPFGGTKCTGNGHREAGPQALDEFTEWKAVSVDFSGRLQRAQMDEE
ncbi:MAG: aldehyde dehydrogenase family protein [Actinomycetota bacterium]